MVNVEIILSIIGFQSFFKTNAACSSPPIKSIYIINLRWPPIIDKDTTLKSLVAQFLGGG